MHRYKACKLGLYWLLTVLSCLFCIGCHAVGSSIKSESSTFADARDILYEGRLSATWNNTLAGLLSSNRVTTAHDMIVLRVAYDIGGIRAIQDRLNPEELEIAQELYVAVYDTLRTFEHSTNRMKMVPKYKEGVDFYYQEIRSLLPPANPDSK